MALKVYLLEGFISDVVRKKIVNAHRSTSGHMRQLIMTTTIQPQRLGEGDTRWYLGTMQQVGPQPSNHNGWVRGTHGGILAPCNRWGHNHPTTTVG